MRTGMGLGALANVIHPYQTMAEAVRQCGDASNRTRVISTMRTLFDRLMSFGTLSSAGRRAPDGALAQGGGQAGSGAARRP